MVPSPTGGSTAVSCVPVSMVEGPGVGAFSVVDGPDVGAFSVLPGVLVVEAAAARA